MNEEKNTCLSYPEDFQEVLSSLVFLPEEVRPIIMNKFISFMAFGLF